jgi:hypothetical protein
LRTTIDTDSKRALARAAANTGVAMTTSPTQFGARMTSFIG